jgi:hypothetical protein
MCYCGPTPGARGNVLCGMRWLVKEILKSAWQQGLPSLDYPRSTIIQFELKRLDGLKSQQLIRWLWWKPGCCVETIALIRWCRVVPFNASFMILKRLREALREGGASWYYSVKLPLLFFLPLASTSTHTSRWFRQERNCILSESRLSSIFKIFLRIAPILVGGKIVRMQLWRPAASYSLFGRNFKFNAGVFLRHFFNCTRLQSGAKPPILIGCFCGR